MRQNGHCPGAPYFNIIKSNCWYSETSIVSLSPKSFIISKVYPSANEVISVVDDASGDNYTITHRNDFGEEQETFCTYEDMFKLYVFVDEER